MIANAYARADGGVRKLDPAEVSRAGGAGVSSLVWLDFVDPTSEDLDLLDRLFHFHPLSLEDVSRRHQRPKVDEYQDYYFVVLYAVCERPEGPTDVTEVQLFWQQDCVVTVRGEELPEIDALVGWLTAPDMRALNGRPVGAREVTTADIVYRLSDAIVDAYFPVVDQIAERSEDIEERMFNSRRMRGALQEIFTLKKELIRVRRVIAPSRDVFNVLLRRNLPVLPPEYVPYFQDVYDHTVRVIDSLDTYRDLLSSSIDIYLSLTSNQVNETVKRMTAVTAVLMLDALIAGVYGMNFQVMPELQWTYGYLFALGLMALVSLVSILVFRKIRWL